MAMSFSKWITSGDKAAYQEVKSYVAAHPEDWKFVQSLEEAWTVVDNDPNVAADAPELKRVLALAFVSYEREQPNKAKKTGGVTAFGIGVFLFMGAIIVILAGAIFETTILAAMGKAGADTAPLLTRLADVEIARGLITFVFTVGVIALALIIVTANVTAGEEEASRFDRSKEILTSLIAILGTILGFYFGKADSEPVVVATPTEQVEEDAAPADEELGFDPDGSG